MAVGLRAFLLAMIIVSVLWLATKEGFTVLYTHMNLLTVYQFSDVECSIGKH